MKKFLMTTAALALLATTAQAKDSVTPIYAHGFWRTSIVQSGNTQMCLMQSHWDFGAGVDGTVFLKWTAKNGLFMHIAKSSWKFEPGLEVPMTLYFDKGSREGVGKTIESYSDPGLNMIEIGINVDDAVGFLEDVAEADKMTIQFKEGNEQSWIGKMIGSRNAVRWFNACIAKVGAVSTSPVGPKATQPVGNKPAAKKDDGGI